ncbi:MAG: hypothetical protein ACYS26_16780 [Planctomycetota bacterium]
MQISTDLLRLLQPLAEQAGVELPGAVELVPEINLNDPVIRIGEQLGNLLSHREVFRMGEQIVTIEDGRMAPVSAARFCSLVERWVTTLKHTQSGPKVMTMGTELANKIMECLEFRERLRQLDGVLPVRAPVRREDGTVELLAAGYDEASRVYCCDAVDFEQDWEVGRGMGWLMDVLGEFEWADSEGQTFLFSNRSFCVQVAAMLSAFCRLLIPTGTPRPMIVWVANQQGSGKSVLAEGALAPVFGEVATTTNPESREEFTKLLDTAAINMRSYLFLDDAPGYVASGALNRFVTSRRHSGRIMGGQMEFDVPAVTQVLLTGNNLELTPDLMRRALAVELFLPGEIEGRTFKRVIEPGWWARPEVRRDALSALWSLVRHWDEVGRPMGNDRKPTFETWSGVIGGILESLPDAGQGIGRAMSKANLPMAGDRRGQEWRELLMDIASNEETPDDGESPHEFTTTEIVEEARHRSLLEDVVGTTSDKPLTAKELRRLGLELKRWRGRVMKDKRGRSFEFGSRRQRRGSVYPLRFL